VSRRTTVRCDGPHCTEYGKPLALVEQAGWFLGDERDLCPICVLGERCNGEVGPDGCSCVLPYAHDGICRCRHTVSEVAAPDE